MDSTCKSLTLRRYDGFLPLISEVSDQTFGPPMMQILNGRHNYPAFITQFTKSQFKSNSRPWNGERQKSYSLVHGITQTDGSWPTSATSVSKLIGEAWNGLFWLGANCKVRFPSQEVRLRSIKPHVYVSFFIFSFKLTLTGFFLELFFLWPNRDCYILQYT